MSERLAWILVWILQVYFACGVLFAIPFVSLGVTRIDPAALKSSWRFRLLLLPGAAAFWPWLAIRWIRGQAPRQERNAHRVHP